MDIDQQDIDHALDDGSFHPHFQPIISLETGSLYGFELLARWRHHEHGWISPEIFIPLAEKNGWIDRLTEDLFRSAFCTMAGLEEVSKLSVNISPTQLHGFGLPTSLRKIADETGFSLENLVVEITESALTERPSPSADRCIGTKGHGL